MSYSAITPFAAAKVANIMLRQNGLDIEIRPQMMYNYAKKNLIASNYETRSADEKIYFDGDSFKKWIDRYINAAKNGTVGSRVDYDELADEFNN